MSTESPVDQFFHTRVERIFTCLFILSPVVIAAVAILFLAATESLWLDELTSYWFSSADTLNEVINRMLLRGDPHPPGYQLALHYWMTLTSPFDSALALRLSSIVCFLTTAICLSVLLFRVTQSKVTVFLFCAIYSFTSSSLYYSCELRSYAFSQACFAVLLLARDLGHSGKRERNNFHIVTEVITFSAAFMLSMSHYMGSILVGCLAAVEVISLFGSPEGRIRQPRLKNVLLHSMGYLIGPLTAMSWLIFASHHRGFQRNLEQPNFLSVFRYFVSNIGKIQSLVLICVSLVLIVSVLVSRKNNLGLSKLVGASRQAGEIWNSLNRVGALSICLMLVLLFGISFFKPILQSRNIVISIPTISAVGAILLTSFIRNRTGHVILCLLVFGGMLTGFSLDFQTQSATHDRAREDFWRIASMNRSTIITWNDDLAQKLRDASKIKLRGRPLIDEPRTLYLHSILGGEMVAQPEKLPSTMILACPHCKSKVDKELLRFAKSAGFKCVRVKSAQRDRAYNCNKL